MEQSPSGRAKLERANATYYYKEHLGRVLLLAAVGLWAATRSRHRAWLAVTALVMLAGLFSVVWWPLSSYAAPLLVSYFGLAFLGLKAVRSFRIRGRMIGFYWARGIAVALIVAGLAYWQDAGRRALYKHGKRVSHEL